MNKYTEMSDFEINVKVFTSLYGEESLKDKDMLKFFIRADYCNKQFMQCQLLLIIEFH